MDVLFVFLDNSLNDIQERALSLIYDDDDLEMNFKVYLKRQMRKPYIEKDLEYLAKEINTFLHGLSSPIMNGIFEVKVNIYNLTYLVYSTSKKSLELKRLRIEILRSGT